MRTIPTPERGSKSPARHAAERRVRQVISRAEGRGVGRALRRIGVEPVAAVLAGAEPFARACRERAAEAGRGPELEAWAVVSTRSPEEIRRRLARGGTPVPERPRRAPRHWRQGPEGLGGPASFGPEPGPAHWQRELTALVEALSDGSPAGASRPR